MKSLLTFASVLMAAFGSAQMLPDIPDCSVRASHLNVGFELTHPQMQCFLDSLMNDGCPDLLDFGCHCQKPELVSKVTPCVKSSCGIPEQASESCPLSPAVSQCLDLLTAFQRCPTWLSSSAPRPAMPFRSHPLMGRRPQLPQPVRPTLRPARAHPPPIPCRRLERERSRKPRRTPGR